MNKLAISYLLWAIGFIIPIHGLHRFYNGKVGTGTLWLCTFGLFGIAQLLDVLVIPSMVEEHNAKIKAKLGVSSNGVPLYSSISTVSYNITPTTQEQFRVKLLKAAATRGGKLSVTQGVMATGASFQEVENVLNQMLKSGYVGIGNDPETGIVLYDFYEL
ncbi:TM2 domain-containing protein [Capilliphycus salinus ALCB114379]|uniref:TM2 domain-containing protein n=1 Tax=Capilliphycus salinus TaxID=2768948 RepID=UPI0039A431E9